MGERGVQPDRDRIHEEDPTRHCTLVAATLAAVPLAAQAKHHKKHNAATSTTSSQTTGSNMKSGRDSTSSSQGNVGPGTNQAGSMGK
ncbi:hypothetical protein [Bradyrhizobium sp. SZCCHNR1051]|uniref:hypothetical protein n=1 Tax=Bradyrhizobium sp. SZCCHNR1051 TaxID=3057355 RepID=UPI003967A4CE